MTTPFTTLLQHFSSTLWWLEVFDHPPHSLDLALLHSATKGHCFANEQVLKKVVHMWFGTHLKTFYSEGVQKIVQ
jgi:hypothetical protein